MSDTTFVDGKIHTPHSFFAYSYIQGLKSAFQKLSEQNVSLHNELQVYFWGKNSKTTKNKKKEYFFSSCTFIKKNQSKNARTQSFSHSSIFKCFNPGNCGR